MFQRLCPSCHIGAWLLNLCYTGVGPCSLALDRRITDRYLRTLFSARQPEGGLAVIFETTESIPRVSGSGAAGIPREIGPDPKNSAHGCCTVLGDRKVVGECNYFSIHSLPLSMDERVHSPRQLAFHSPCAWTRGACGSSLFSTHSPRAWMRWAMPPDSGRTESRLSR